MHNEVEFYDTQAERKLRDFLNHNKRVERGWQTIVDWGGAPSRILEIGCGVGSICWRMSRRYKNSEVVGIDFSPGNLSIANRLFKASNLTFALMSGTEDLQFGTFNLIVLMDVYEHVAISQRRELHANLRKSLAKNGRIVLTFPTPRHLEWLRLNNSQEIQPVDEDITPEIVCKLAKDVGRDLIMYREVDIWRRGDYAHAILGESKFPEPAPSHAASRFRLSWLAEKRDTKKRTALAHKAGFKL